MSSKLSKPDLSYSMFVGSQNNLKWSVESRKCPSFHAINIKCQDWERNTPL